VSSVTNEALGEALVLWNAARATEAGALICTHIPDAVRPFWAARILELCRGRVRSPLAVRAVCFIAKRPCLWPWGHVAFDEVRCLTLRWERGKKTDEAYGGLLCLAENVAKVTYNATSPCDPFDDDAGAWVVSCLRYLVDTIQDPEFETRAWQLATRTEM
jgi:hypothetical protein